MTFGYQIFPELKAISVRYTGTYSAQALISTFEVVWADPRYSRDFVGIVDLTEGAASIGIDDLRTVIAFVEKSDRTSRASWAAVTNSPVATAIIMIYRRAMQRRHNFEVFSGWEAACNFVQVDVPRVASPQGSRQV